MKENLEFTPKEEILQEVKQLRRAMEFIRIFVFFIVVAIVALIGVVVLILQLIR